MTQDTLQQLFASNRAEELGFDVWERYVLPPFFQALSLGNTRKPHVIVGGRGCGKTMLLRYLSHDSAFSPSRQQIPHTSLSHIGLYWRSDTQFASLMQHREIPVDTWENAFGHLAALVIGIEILRSLESIASSALKVITDADLASLDFGRLRAYSPDLPQTMSGLKNYLEDCMARFEIWVNNVRDSQQPQFLPDRRFARRLVELILQQLPQLAGATFFVYIDEYENLAEYQQRIINTWVKHSEPPLIFNLAMKRNGFKTRSTAGAESLSAVHDYRPIDIEAFDLDREFPVFAAEIMLMRVRPAGVAIDVIDPLVLRDPAHLATRRDAKYANRILAEVRRVFPSISQQELAGRVLSDSTLRRRLKQRIERSLTARGYAVDRADDLLMSANPEAAVIVPALLRRESLSLEDIISEVKKLGAGEPNRFTGPTDWIHNNFVGCLLQIYEGLGRPCPLYSGFGTFCLMSRGNLRHFLELCHKTLAREERDPSSGALGVVSVEMQAAAARQVATDLLPEVKSFGPKGNNLHTFLLRLGSLFSLSQQSPSQSEPERTHFAIQEGQSEIGPTETAFVLEAVKWSVLFEEPGTKKKETAQAEGVEYVLNPIYSPYFHISYRKIRRLDLPSADVTTLIGGDYAEVSRLLREFQKKWSVDLTESPLPLFAHLEKGNNE